MDNALEALLQLQEEGPKITDFASRGKLSTKRDILFFPRMFAKVALPQSDPKQHTFLSRNGKEVLHLATLYEISKDRKSPKPLGLPFGRVARKHITKINHIYPEMNYSFESGTLVLYKSPTHVKEESTK